jgi:hypothetical protein
MHLCFFKLSIGTQGFIHETQTICKSLTKRQIQCFNNISCGCHGFEFAMPYRTLPGFVNDPLNIAAKKFRPMSTCEVRLFLPKGCFRAYVSGMTVVDEIFCPP